MDYSSCFFWRKRGAESRQWITEVYGNDAAFVWNGL